MIAQYSSAVVPVTTVALLGPITSGGPINKEDKARCA